MHSPQFHVDHVFTTRRLSAYLDGELGADECRRVERHIDACPGCRRTVRSLHLVVGGLTLLRRCDPSRLAANVIERLRSQARRDDDASRRWSRDRSARLRRR